MDTTAKELHVSREGLLALTGPNGSLPAELHETLRQTQQRVKEFAEAHHVAERDRVALESILVGYVANRVRLVKLNPQTPPELLEQASLASTQRTLRANLPAELADAAIQLLPQLPKMESAGG